MGSDRMGGFAGKHGCGWDGKGTTLYNANDSHNKSKTIKIVLGLAKIQNTEDQMFYRHQKMCFYKSTSF